MRRRKQAALKSRGLLTEEDEKTVDRFAAWLERPSDHDLNLIDESQQRAIMELLVDWRRRKRRGELPAPLSVAMHMSDLIGQEKSRRRELLRHAETELGHQP